MKLKNIFRFLLCSILIVSSITIPVKAKVSNAIESSNVTPIGFTVPSAGWYRVGELTRGLIKVVVSISGGAHKPQNLVIEAYKDWGSGLFLRAEGSTNNYITQVRLTYDASKYYIEIYSTQALTSNAYFYHYETEGYAGSFSPNSGTLPTGGGVIKKESGNVCNNDYSSGGINLAGSLGIGTSSPEELLQVGKTSQRDVNIKIGERAAIGLSSTHAETMLGNNAIVEGSNIVAIKSVSGASAITMNWYNGIKFFTTRGTVTKGQVINTSTFEKFRITPNDGVFADEVNVKLQSAWPDFVFDKDYNLMPLTEIEAYIKQNHHLPEVPSAAEMEANGVELGKMNMLLLQKIEELTLHQIEQNKQIELLLQKAAAQEKEITNLKNKN